MDKIDWTDIRITVPNAYTDIASDIAHMTVDYGIYIEDYADLEQGAREIAHIDLIDGELLAKDRTYSIIHIYLSPEAAPGEALAFLTERYTDARIPYKVDTRSICEEDWANNWKQYFKPMNIGTRLTICPLWEQAEETGRAVLRIDPGMAFGTGGHHTTQLCMELLEGYITPSSTFLDVGCGSGILSIAALLLGAERATGADIDPLAVKTALENGRHNQFEPPKYTIYAGNLVDKISGTFSIIASNIVADAVITLSSSVARHMDKDSVWISSGIIDTREQEVLDAFDRNGYTVVERRETGGWVCFACKLAIR